LRDEENFFEFRNSSFASKLQHLTLSHDQGFDLDDDYVTEFLEMNLTSIKIDLADLSLVSDELLAHLVTSCKKCDITEYYGSINYFRNGEDEHQRDYCLGVKKIAAIIRSLQYGSNLKSFKLGFRTINFDYDYEEGEEGDGRMRLDISFIPPEILAAVFSRLREIDLSNLKLGSEQMRSIAESGLGNLTKFSLCGIPLDKEKLMHLLEALDKTHKMKSLKLSKINLKEIPPVFLSQVINKVESVVLSDVEIETCQIEDTFLGIIRGDSVMKHFVLDLYIPHENKDESLTQVNAEILAKAVNKLESVGFSSSLSKEQSKEMFEVMSLKTNLKSLESIQKERELYFPSYYRIEPHVLARALNNLRIAQIDFEREGCSLSWPQLIAFVKQLNFQTSLETILSDRGVIKAKDLILN